MLQKLRRCTPHLDYAPTNTYRLDYTSSLDGVSDWAIVVPGQTEICIVNLHGHGSHGDQLFTRVDIREFWLGTFLDAKAAILCPNLRDNAWMSPSAVDDLANLLEYMRSEHHSKKFVFFSGSMGATGNLIYSTRQPEDVHACIALGAATDLSSFCQSCIQHPFETMQNEIGRAIERSYACKPKDVSELLDAHSTLKNCDKLTMPVFFAHGSADRLIPVEQARQLAAAMQGKSNFSYVEIEDGNHNSPCFLPAAIDFIMRTL